MRKYLIILVTVILGNLAYGSDYKFMISHYNDNSGMISGVELNYSGSKVNVIEFIVNAFGPGKSESECVNSNVKHLELDNQGIVWFVSNSGEKVAGIYSNNAGSEGFIVFLRDGVLKQTKPDKVDNNFTKDYLNLKKHVGLSSSSNPGYSPGSSSALGNNYAVSFQDYINYPLGLIKPVPASKEEYERIVRDLGVDYDNYYNRGFLNTQESEFTIDGQKVHYVMFSQPNNYACTTIRMYKLLGNNGKQNIQMIFNKYKKELLNMGYRLEKEDNNMNVGKKGNYPPRPLETKFLKGNKKVSLNIFHDYGGGKGQWELEIIATFPR